MLLPQTIQVVLSIPTGETDHGSPIYAQELHSTRGQVAPLGTDLTLSSDRLTVVQRYQLILAPTLDLPTEGVLTVGWDAFPITGDDGTFSGGRVVDGNAERHYHRGRLHHYELVTQ